MFYSLIAIISILYVGFVLLFSSNKGTIDNYFDSHVHHEGKIKQEIISHMGSLTLIYFCYGKKPQKHLNKNQANKNNHLWGPDMRIGFK